MPTSIVTISTFTTSPETDISVDSDIHLRGWYTASFIAGDGVTPVEGGNGQTGFYYDIPCSLNGSNEVVVPAFSIEATTLSNPSANFMAQLWVDGAPDKIIIPNRTGGAGWQIPTLYGLTINFAQLALYNRAKRLLYPPPTYLTADDVLRLINLTLGAQGYMAVGINGIGSADTAPTVPSLPVVVMANSPKVSAFNFHVSQYASFNLAVAAAAVAGGTVIIDANSTVTGNVSVPATVAVWGTGHGQLSGAFTVTFLGPLDGVPSRIFESNVTVSFSGCRKTSRLLTEWWGAVADGSTDNFAAIQAAFTAAGSTGVSTGAISIQFLKGTYNISDTIVAANYPGFHIYGANKLTTVLQITTANKDVLYLNYAAYGVMERIRFTTTATSTTAFALVDLDADGTISGAGQLKPQQITIRDCEFHGNFQASLGLRIAKTGGSAQGDTILLSNNLWLGCTSAGLAIGGSGGADGFQADNALSIQIVNGNIQHCNTDGIRSYGGSFFLDGTSFQAAAGHIGDQTGYDINIANGPSGAEISIRNIRSESVRMINGTSKMTVENCANSIDARPWYSVNDSTSYANAAFTLGMVITGTNPGGDGKIYKCTVAGTTGGTGLNTATSGTLSAITKTGAGWTVNAFAGYRATILVGTGIGQYQTIASNTADTLTLTGNWNAPQYSPTATVVAADATSQFVVEPLWNSGTVVSGGATFQLLDTVVVSGAFDMAIRDCHLNYGRVLVGSQAVIQNVFVTRADWLGATGLYDGTSYASLDLVRVTGSDPTVVGNYGYVPWTVPSQNAISNSYSAVTTQEMGAKAQMWRGGAGGLRYADIGIGRGDGSRSDNADGFRSSRNPVAIIGDAGMLGRPSASGTNVAGVPLRLQGGLSTGNAVAGILEMWLGSVGASGASVNVGTRKAFLDANGFNYSTPIIFTPVAFAAGATTPSVVGGVLFTTANVAPTSITDFTGSNGQFIIIGVTDANTTFVNGATIVTRSGANIVASSGLTYTFVKYGGVWHQIN